LVQPRFLLASEPTVAPDHNASQPAAESAVTETHNATDVHTTTAQTAHAAEASGGIGAIGVDPRALAFQLVNFAILFWVLKKVAYKPILAILSDRQKKIEDSLKTATQIEKDRLEMADERERLIKKAREEAETIVGRARSEAAETVKEAEVKASAKAEQILADAHGRIETDITAARQSLKKEMAGLVISATATIIDEKLDAQKDEALLEKALAGTK
jgi:F-type H+-transporting ATPase subunit b